MNENQLCQYSLAELHVLAQVLHNQSYIPMFLSWNLLVCFVKRARKTPEKLSDYCSGIYLFIYCISVPSISLKLGSIKAYVRYKL